MIGKVGESTKLFNTDRFQRRSLQSNLIFFVTAFSLSFILKIININGSPAERNQINNRLNIFRNPFALTQNNNFLLP